jgi:hypothetical protein
MAALEYLTENSLTAYPFKSRKASDTVNEYPIQDDWFLDILFVSKKPEIRSVYIASIEKTSPVDIAVRFANAETDQIINATPVVLAWADHYRNFAQSFAYATTGDFLLKVVFGPGLSDMPLFLGNYTKDDTELLSSAIILYGPKVSSLDIKTYNSRYSRLNNVPDLPYDVASYTFPEVPLIAPRYNTTFSLSQPSTGSLEVKRGLGAGIHDDCPVSGEIQDIYSVNGIVPDDAGKMYLKTSACYSANVLTANDVILFGEYLAPYNAFEVYDIEGNKTSVNLSYGFTDHAITIENFCKPKCAPENLAAFAHYLNRVTDGAKELVTSVFGKNETRGKGTFDPIAKKFTATSFCDPLDTTFVRCATSPDPSGVTISCSSLFKKYFHEGRTLQVRKDNMTLLEYPIYSVDEDGYTVNLYTDAIIPEDLPEDLSFRVLDNGIVTDLNCSIQTYNALAATFTNPYFKVSHITNEAYNPEGLQVNYLSVSIAIYNPSTEPIEAQISIDKIAWQAYGSLKARNNNGEYTVGEDSIVTIGCRDYIYVQAVYYVSCGVSTAAMDISVFDVTTATQQIGDTYTLPTFETLICTDSSSTESMVLLEQNQQAFLKELMLPTGTTAINYFGSIPDWMIITPDYPQQKVVLSTQVITPPQSNDSFNIILQSYANGKRTSTQQLNIDYVAKPIIWSPSSNSFEIDKTTEYSSASPLLQVKAYNMPPAAQAETGGYTITWTNPPVGVTDDLPEGLVFDPTSGKLTGQLGGDFLNGDTLTFSLGAYNLAGTALSPALVTLTVVISEPFTLAASALEVLTDNLSTYTSEEPLIQLTATPSTGVLYYVVGILPIGFTLNNQTGAITGRYTGSTNKTYAFSTYAKNTSQLKSNVVQLSVGCTAYVSPKIASPEHGQIINTYGEQVTTLADPLLTVIASQAFGGLDNYALGLTDTSRNHYTATGLPPGYQIDLYSGKLYGALASSEFSSLSIKNYAISLKATNPIGGDMVAIVLRATKSGAPQITNIASNETRIAAKEIEYTEESPFLTIKATNTPTSYNVSGLPTGLTCSNTGKIIGKILSATSAGKYNVSATATNEVASSVPVPFYIQVPVSITFPLPGTVFDITTSESYDPLTAVEVCDTLDDSAVNVSATGLPAGLSLVTTSDPAVIQGKPTTSAQGSSVLTASSSLYGTSSIQVFFGVGTGAFQITGTVVDSLGAPVSGVTVTVAGMATLSGSDGSFTLANISAGSYNLQASKPGLSITPERIPVEVLSTSIDGVTFVASTGRLVSGYIRTDTGTNVQGIQVTCAGFQKTTDSFGFFALFIPSNVSAFVVPASNSYTFEPIRYEIAAGTVAVEQLLFIATATGTGGGSGELQLTNLQAQDRELLVDITIDSEDNLDHYEYSINAGSTYAIDGAPAITQVSSLDTSLNISFRVGEEPAGTQYYYSLDGGTTYFLAALPTALQNLSIQEGQNTLRILFAEPAQEENVVTIEYSLDGGPFVPLPYRGASYIDIPHLDNNVQYSVVIRSANLLGSGIVSSPLIGTPRPLDDIPIVESNTAAPPEMLKDVSVSISSAEAIIYFTAPAVKDNVSELVVDIYSLGEIYLAPTHIAYLGQTSVNLFEYTTFSADTIYTVNLSAANNYGPGAPITFDFTLPYN